MWSGKYYTTTQLSALQQAQQSGDNSQETQGLPALYQGFPVQSTI